MLLQEAVRFEDTVDIHKTYLRRLEGVLVGDLDIDDEGTASVACVNL